MKVILFDLDDTLAVSKSRLDPIMATLLSRLLERVDVCIISGGRYEQFQNQVLSALDSSADLERLHLMPTCGTQYYRWFRLDGWVQQYAEDLTEDEKQRALTVMEEGARQLGIWETETWGPVLEDRGSQITFSALGQSAPVDVKLAWDPDGQKKEALRAYAAERLPDLEPRSGGSTSVDVTRLGIDKAYGVDQLCRIYGLELSDLLFVGDRLDEGGNDYPVKAMGVECVAVHGWQDTAQYLTRLLESLPLEDPLTRPGAPN
ncbi:MAG TPA: HAD-IIB family hydrolase [Propionibacteriaceae bacterium]|nr:HAD-IIB family hydrolase [Propionibacteriaceae bacterium]